jgi:hypothetical protein
VFGRWSRRRRAAARPEPRPPVERFTASYEPELDGDPDPGEVVWVWIPYEDDPHQGKDRPVVVVGRAADDLVVVPLTTKPHPERDDEIEVGRGGWDRTGRISYAKVDDVLHVKAGEVRREGAILDRPRFDAVVAGVAAYRARHPGR